MPNLVPKRVMGSYNLTCRTNPNHKKNEWCSSCLWDQNQVVSSTKSETMIKKSTPKKKTTKKKSTQPSKKKQNQLALVPTLTSKHTRTKSSPTDYYNCLLNYAQAGFYDSKEGKLKIHSCCKKCKALAPSLNNQRDKELVTLITSYKQVGDSLAKLLRPLS